MFLPQQHGICQEHGQAATALAKFVTAIQEDYFQGMTTLARRGLRDDPHRWLIFFALTNGLGYVSGGRLWPQIRIPVNHPLDGPTGAFYVKGPVTGYGGIGSSLKVLKVP